MKILTRARRLSRECVVVGLSLVVLGDGLANDAPSDDPVKPDVQSVATLVEALASKRPAPLEMGGKLTGDLKDYATFPSGPYATDEVKVALRQLSEIPPSAFPALIEHLDDDRYSYSYIAPWASPNNSGWMNDSVGDAIYRSLSNDYYLFCGGYKSRAAADGDQSLPPSFGDYVKQRGGMEAWAKSVAPRTRCEVFTEFLDWCIARETAAGFEDEESKEWVLGWYEREKLGLVDAE